MLKTRKLLSVLFALLLAVGTLACKGTDQPTPPDPVIPEDPLAKYAEVPVKYEPLDAEFEDASLSLWFDHAFAKTTAGDAESTGRQTYKIYMGKNELEDFQFFLSTSSDRTVSLAATDFVNESGETVSVSLFYQYCFAMPFGDDGAVREVPDALPPVKEGQSFALEAGKPSGFLIQAETLPETPAGEYTAVLNILDADARQIKTVKLFLRVWNFELSDRTECRTAMWIDRNSLLGMDYTQCYDYLLKNRVNAYDLPYALSDSRADEYLNNPRVNSFNILGFKYNKESGKTDAQIKNGMKAAYQKLSPNADWFSKGYFYLVDEPNPAESAKLEWIKMYGEWLAEYYPGYRQLSPFFTDEIYGEGLDWIEFLKPYINIWVPKTYAYTTLKQAADINGGQTLYASGLESYLEKKYGSYPERIAELVESGHEAWWYVTSQPTDPYVTLNTTEPGVGYRTMFWQQKMNDVKGFLYWSVNYFTGNGWNNREAEWQPGSKTYGNGQLIYPGNSTLGVKGPVGSLRLEAIRDGIEDYQMFSMLESKIGGAAVKSFINRVTTHVAVWQKDDDVFAGERVRLGNYLEAILAQ